MKKNNEEEVLITHDSNLLTEEILKKRQIIMFEITKKEIITMNYDRINQLFNIFLTYPKYSKQKLILSIDGFNEDERAIMEIKEIRTYMAKLLIDNDYLFSLLSPFEESNVLMAACICSVKTTKSNDDFTFEIVPDDDVINYAVNGSINFMLKYCGIDIENGEIKLNDLQRKLFKKEAKHVMDSFNVYGELEIPF